MRLELSHLHKRFGEVEAVTDFSLSVADGEFLVLLGPSGCGKTTALRLIAGLEVPDAGTIHVDGLSWDGLPPQRRNVAMVFQHFALYPHRSVGENIEYPLRIRRIPPKERLERVVRVARSLGILELLERRPRQLSVGEAQRVAVARALVREPHVFLMDEPLSSIDVTQRLTARDEIREVQSRFGVTTMYVTHDQDEAVALADRLAIMVAGRLEQVGSPEDLFARPATLSVARLLGRPPVNLLAARVIGDAGEGTIVRLTCDDGAGPTAGFLGALVTISDGVMVGVRPDCTQISGPSNVSLPGWRIPGKLVGIEGVAPDYLIRYRSPAGLIALRARDRDPPVNAELFLPVDGAHFFDAHSGHRVEVSTA